MTQEEQILNHLKLGEHLTPLKALHLFGTFRLSARIFDLKQKGWPIECTKQDIGDGKSVGYYILVNDKDQWPEQ